MDNLTAEKRFLVTGTSSGIGLRIATDLLDAGHNVTGIDNEPAPPELTGRITEIRTDLLQDQAFDLLKKNIEPDAWDGFIHCAGRMRAYKLGCETPAAAEELFRLHVSIPVAIGNLVLPTMAPNGRVILFASRAIYGSPERGLYAASKSALLGLARSWALEVAPHGVTVNIIAPGPVDTPMLKDPERANRPALTGSSMPIGRLITAEEISATALFVLSAGAAAITGQVINVCGGGSLVAGS